MSETKTEGAAGKPAARLVCEPKTITLTYPVEFDGKEWTEITVRRAGGREIREFMVAASEDTVSIMPPGVDCPIDVWDAMDFDDQAAVNEAVDAFMPARLKEAIERASAIGDNTSSS